MPDDEPRSNCESVPGDEFPTTVYRSMVIAFAWMMLAAWLAFGGTGGTDLDLAVATVLFAVFLALPIIMHRTAANRVVMNHNWLGKDFGRPKSISQQALSPDGKLGWRY